MPSALIASNVRLYREGIALALSRGDAVHVAGTIDSAAAAIEALVSLQPDVLLLDMAMPQALALARSSATLPPPCRPHVIAFAVGDVDDDLVACAEAGIAGFVPRDASLADLTAAINCVASGEAACSPRATATLLRRLVTLAAQRDDGDSARALTGRELEIADLVARGLSNKEIADRLRIGLTTVKNHVHHVLEKLGVRRRGQTAAALRGASR